MRDQWRRRMARLIQDKVSIQAALMVKAAFVRQLLLGKTGRGW